MATMTAARGFRIETETCTRCGGSGKYSYCQRYGTTCFKCGGSGKSYTANGKKALAAIEAKRDELYGKLPADVKPGDKVWFNAIVGMKAGWHTILESYPDPLNKGLHTLVVKGLNSGVFDSKIVRVWNPEVPAKVVEFALTLKGVVEK